MIRAIVLGVACLAVAHPASAQSRAELNAMIAAHARANGVPVKLVHRIIRRESMYRPGAIGRGGAMGLMQIKTATARGLGYTGPARGLLDAETNLKYAVRYLAGAYRVAGGNHDRAVSYYARGYYYAAKRKGMLDTLGPRSQSGSDALATVGQAVSGLVRRAAKAFPTYTRDGRCDCDLTMSETTW